MCHAPEIPFELDEKKFSTNLRTSRRGAAAGPSGMTTEHLRLVLDTVHHAQLLFKLGEQLSRAETPTTIVNSVRLGRLTALQKPNGGVRGVVAADILRRLVGRTMAQQLSDVVKAATAPFQCALSTRAGTECHGPCIAVIDRGEPKYDGDVNRRHWGI